MKRTLQIDKKAHGFTLTEMAVVLIIVALLIGGMLMPLSAQQDLKNESATQKVLGEAIEAIYGYAAARPGAPYLPCPDADGDGGEEARDAGGNCPILIGNLPWATLGVGHQDGWGRPLKYAVASPFAHANGFALTTSLASASTPRVCAEPTCGQVIANAVPAVVFSLGKNGVSEQPPASSPPIYVVRSAASDDLLAWLSHAVLFNRMISAGRLP